MCEEPKKLQQIKQIKLFFEPTLFAILLVLVMFSPSWAATYYVDATNGNDSNAGTSEATPWKTISKVNSLSFHAGDNIYFKKGEVWRETAVITSSGTAENPIRFDTYGTGSKPIVDGENIRVDSFILRSKEYIIINGFEMKNQTHRGVYLQSSGHVTIQNNVMKGLKVGIQAEDACTSLKIFNNEITNCESAGISIGYSSDVEIAYNDVDGTANVGNGIWAGYSTNVIIHHNKSINNYWNGIGISHSSGCSIHSNIAIANSCGDDKRYAGIAIEVDAENNEVFNNLMLRNCNAGFLTNSSNNEIYNNVMYGNLQQVSMGDWQGSLPESNVYKNNIFVLTDESHRAVAIWKYKESFNPLTNIFDYNLYYFTSGPDKENLAAIGASSPYDGWYPFSKWQSIGKEANGIVGNPLFIDPSDNNFHLQQDSPCINTGTNVGVDYDYDGNARPMGINYDIGAYEAKQNDPPTGLRIIQ